MKLIELCDLHHFIIEAEKRLRDRDENGNILPFDSDSQRRSRQSWDASMIVLDHILEGHYDHS